MSPRLPEALPSLIHKIPQKPCIGARSPAQPGAGNLAYQHESVLVESTASSFVPAGRVCQHGGKHQPQKLQAINAGGKHHLEEERSTEMVLGSSRAPIQPREIERRR